MSPTIVTPLLCLAAVYAVAAYVLRPPRFVPWPPFRSACTDVSLLRVSLQGGLRASAEEALRAERQKVSDLTTKAADAAARIATLTAERDTARTQAYAAVRLAEEDALVIVRDMIEREAAEAGESSETIAGRILRLA